MGGNCDGNVSSLIAKYSSNKWDRVGNLQDSRRYHRAIVNDDRIYVVGGEGTRYVICTLNLLYQFLSKTEIWSLDDNDDTVNMKLGEPSLYNYRYYPELFIVDSDFCTKK